MNLIRIRQMAALSRCTLYFYASQTVLLYFTDRLRPVRLSFTDRASIPYSLSFYTSRMLCSWSLAHVSVNGEPLASNGHLGNKVLIYLEPDPWALRHSYFSVI